MTVPIHQPHLLAPAAAVAGCLLLAACSSSSPSPIPSTSTAAAATATGEASSPTLTSDPVTAAAPAGDPCALVTEQDITAIAGSDPGVGTGDSQAGATACTYGAYPQQVIQVNMVPAHGKAAFDRFRNDPKLSGAGINVVDVTGLGEEAFERSGPHVDAVYFTTGDSLTVIGVSTPGAPTQGAARALATVAAGRR